MSGSFADWRTETYDTPYRFTGKEQDAETGLYYYGARYYDPRLGRFLSVDRYAEKYPSLNPYNYCANNPLKFIDVNGDSIIVNKFGEILRNDKTDNLVFLQQKGKLKSLGELGGTIDINYIYTNTLQKNINEAEDINSPFEFKNYVKNNGKWDLKNNMKTIYGLGNDGKTKFIFQGQKMESQDIGNHHFGSVSLAYGLFPGEDFILKQAGKAQMAAGTSKSEWQKYSATTTYSPYGGANTQTYMLPPYGDDPRDQKWIKEGFKYYKK